MTKEEEKKEKEPVIFKEEREVVKEYQALLAHPVKFFLFNFVAGLGRGLGLAVGMTLIFAVVLFILSKLLVGILNLPVIGTFVAELVQYVNQYLKQGVPVR